MTNQRTIPFNRPYTGKRSLEYMSNVVASGKMSGDGQVCKSVESLLESMFGTSRALLTSSCTHALEMSMMLLGLRPGDEVIVPSFTFVSTANAVLSGGGKPVFCEIDGRTQTMDPRDVERRLSPRTRAIIPVHYAGVAAEMDGIMELARAKKLTVVEDAAQGVNAAYKGKFLGTIGDIGTYSFHDTKNYISGEGGALLTDNEEIARRAEILREKGTNRSNFLRGEVDKYTWVSHGSSYILSDILAALLQAQLEELEFIQESRRAIHERYVAGLAGLEKTERLRLPVIPPHCRSNYHIFYILLRDEAERMRIMKEMNLRGIGTTFHYVPLHSAPFARAALGTGQLELPVTDNTYQRLLRLPIYPQLAHQDVDAVIENLSELLR
jgi:dTDP-4-amino-4,6-dideoxygalactose transaminase